MDTGYNEGATGLANDLIPLGVMFDTLFEIQIKDIVADIAQLMGIQVGRDSKLLMFAPFHLNPITHPIEVQNRSSGNLHPGRESK